MRRILPALAALIWAGPAFGNPCDYSFQVVPRDFILTSNVVSNTQIVTDRRQSWSRTRVHLPSVCRP